MSLFDHCRAFSTSICVTKNDREIFGNGFFVGKFKDNPKFFLFVDFNFIKGATSLKFLKYSEKEGYQWIDFPDFAKNCRESKYGIVKINISKMIDNFSRDCFPVENIISDDEVDKFNILETLYIVSAPLIKYPAFEFKIGTPIIEDCKNVISLKSAKNGFFIVNLNNADWRVGAPVYTIFGEKIKLVGMVGDWETPEGLTPVIPANVIRTGIEEKEV